MQSNDGVSDTTNLALNNGGDNDNLVSSDRDASTSNANENSLGENRLDMDEQPIVSQSTDQLEEVILSSDNAKTSSVAGSQDAIIAAGELESFLQKILTKEAFIIILLSLSLCVLFYF